MARVDEEQLNASLEMFNAGLARNAQAAKAKQAVEKAERRKTEAAGTLKKVQGRQSATPEERAEAEAAYRAAVEEFNRLRAGGDPIETHDETHGQADAEKADPTEDAATEDAATEPDRAAADEPADAAASPAEAEVEPPAEQAPGETEAEVTADAEPVAADAEPEAEPETGEATAQA